MADRRSSAGGPPRWLGTRSIQHAGAPRRTGHHRRLGDRCVNHAGPRAEAAGLSVAGLPHLELAAQIAAQANAGGEPFSVVFAAMGLTHPDAATVRDVLENRAAAGELALFLNTADDPVIERIAHTTDSVDGG